MSEALWDVSPPPNAATAMRNYVMRLRRALGPLGVRVVRRPPGWAVTLHGAQELDLIEVERLRNAALAAGEAGDYKRKSGLLATALGLWRGDPLIDIPSAVLTRRDADRLLELRLALTLARIDADLQLARHAELVPELRRLAAEYPLREHIRVQLMIACYRCGYQAAALDVYRDAHRTLAAELGVEPGPELREMHRRILAADRDLSVPAEGGTIPVLLAVPHQLPASVRHFTGRVDELSALSALLDAAESSAAMVIFAVSGTAGVGKTALAVHWAHQETDRFPDGQLYADLRGWGPAAEPVSPADLIGRFLDALGVPPDQMPADAEARRDLYRSLLASRRMLIVLDNARDARHVRPLLPGGASCVVLITSRGRLASMVAAEAAYPLSLDVLTAAEARELLASRLGRERVAAEPDAASELVMLCACMPLALAIAASRAALQPGMSLAMLAGALRDSRGRLAALDAGEGISVEAVFSWSYDQLPGPAKRMFRLLGIHPGPDITVAAAASLAAASPAEAGAMLRQLEEASLVYEHIPGRYRFHDLLRGYAAGRARAEDGQTSQDAATHRALDHYVHSAYAADQHLRPVPAAMAPIPPLRGVMPEQAGDSRQAMAWFGAEHDVLAAVTDLACGSGFDAHGWRLAVTLGRFLDRVGQPDRSLAVQRSALAATQRLSDRQAQAEAHALLSIAKSLLHAGVYSDAEKHYRQALAMCEELGDHAGQALAHLGLGGLAEYQGRYRNELMHAYRTLTLTRSTQARAYLAITLNNLGWTHAHLGEYQQALTYCRQAISLNTDVGDRYCEACAWDSLGYTQSQLGQHPEAIASYQRATALFDQVGARALEAGSLRSLADAHEAAGQPQLAARPRKRAQAILDDLNRKIDSLSWPLSVTVAHYPQPCSPQKQESAPRPPAASSPAWSKPDCCRSSARAGTGTTGSRPATAPPCLPAGKARHLVGRHVVHRFGPPRAGELPVERTIWFGPAPVSAKPGHTGSLIRASLVSGGTMRVGRDLAGSL
jgi:DNA-binding SARP family transcriptional activator/Tfp pilus assembly protein PilF